MDGWHFIKGSTWQKGLISLSPTGDFPAHPGKRKRQWQEERSSSELLTHKALSACRIISPQRTTEGLSHSHLPDKVCCHKQKIKDKKEGGRNKMTKRSTAPQCVGLLLPFPARWLIKTQRQWSRERRKISWGTRKDKTEKIKSEDCVRAQIFH